MAHHYRIGALIALGLWLSSETAATDTNSSLNAEVMLATAMSQINAQQPAQALTTLELLIQRYPHFQLAQMMRADLLYAQTNTLTQIGAHLSNKQTQQLQAEARARLNAVTQLAEQQQPAYLLGAAPHWLNTLITIDLTASRAYFFSLEHGRLVFKTSFYLTQGSLGAGKEKEGDKRTPVGIYRLEKPIPAQKLSGFYGAGALPLDYPNSWDKRNNRTGHGIWLHGTPFEQYSRPPLASDGCVVFSNDDMGYLLQSLDWKSTLVVTDHQLTWKNAETEALAQQLSQRLSAWRHSWEQQQLPSYLAFYAPDFTSQKNENKTQWANRKQQLFNMGQAHHIHIHEVLTLRYPAQNNLVITEFEQRYQRAGKSEQERKRLWWQLQQGEWLIIHEEILSN
jgi:murein L,D-transpeptidase YafK